MVVVGVGQLPRGREEGKRTDADTCTRASETPRARQYQMPAPNCAIQWIAQAPVVRRLAPLPSAVLPTFRKGEAMHDFSIALSHKPGELSRVAEVLSRAGVNLKSVSAMTIGNHAT